MLEVKDLTVAYGRVRAVKGISFNVDQGQVVTLVGTNGARQTNTPTALEKSPGPGHNTWQMVCTALVLFMTLPGLALF